MCSLEAIPYIYMATQRNNVRFLPMTATYMATQRTCSVVVNMQSAVGGYYSDKCLYTELDTLTPFRLLMEITLCRATTCLMQKWSFVNLCAHNATTQSNCRVTFLTWLLLTETTCITCQKVDALNRFHCISHQ